VVDFLKYVINSDIFNMLKYVVGGVLGVGVLLLLIYAVFTLIGTLLGNGEAGRVAAFLFPGIFLLLAGLTIPTVLTIFASMQSDGFNDQGKRRFVGLRYYKEIFAESSSRGVLLNSFMWVIITTTFATVFGLAIARFADGMKGEKTAKSFIFVPIAISLAGAGITWKFIYQGPPLNIGLLNALSKRFWSVLVGVLVVFAVFYLLSLIIDRTNLGKRYAKAPAFVPFLSALIIGALVWRFNLLGFLTSNLPNFPAKLGGDGERLWTLEENLGFLPRWNTVLLIIVGIWVQTGFATMMFSAAIKGVPESLSEAASLDGANSSETFYKVTIPYIRGTIVTVVTFNTIASLKAYDIVAATTGGNFETSTIANEFYAKYFVQDRNGYGSALAVLLFLFVIPIMIVSRRIQARAEAAAY
jgi:alpha-glucoside transport system permease protein